MNKKLAMALSTAKAMAAARAQVRPDSSPQPAKATTRPISRWIQPQLVASNWKV
jgi:hypothetical protein